MRSCYHEQTHMATTADHSYTLSGEFPRWYGSEIWDVVGSMFSIAGERLSTGQLQSESAEYEPYIQPDVDDFATLAKNAMLPSLNDGSSIVNFLIELRDFKHLASTLFGTLGAMQRRLPSIYDGWQILWDAFGQNPWHSKPRRGASAYLSYKLAWQPFVNDCIKLLTKMFDFKAKLKDYERRAKQRQQRYYGKTFKVEPPGGLFEADWTNWVPLSHYAVQYRSRRQETGVNEIRLTAVMRYRYHLPAEFSALVNHLEGYLDILGINGNPAIIWNAIPFTFVVDWFCNVGGFLETLRVDNVQAVTTVTEMSVSQRSERNYEESYQLQLKPQLGDTGVLSRTFGTGIRKVRYKRDIITVPGVLSTLSTGRGLVGSRAAVLAALGTANVPRRPSYLRGFLPKLLQGQSAASILGISAGEQPTIGFTPTKANISI